MEKEEQSKQMDSSSKSEIKEDETTKNPKTNMKIKLLNTIVLITIMGGLILAIYSYLNIGSDSYTNAAQVEGFINPVNARVSAFVKEIRFVEFQHVKAGDTIIVLDNREILTQLGQAEAALENALASKAASENNVRTVTNNISTANANIAMAKAGLWNTKQNFKRYEQLLKDEAVTRQQYDQIKAEYETARAQYEAMLNTRATSELTAKEATSKLRISDAEIERSRNALAMARLNLSYCYIVAPHDGIMGRRTINEGQLLTTAGQQVGTIIDDRFKWVSASFREKQMHAISIGKSVIIKVDALQGRKYEMKVTAVSGATGSRYAGIPLDNSTGNFVKVQQRIPVRLEFSENNSKEALQQLRVGMNVEVNVQQ